MKLHNKLKWATLVERANALKGREFFRVGISCIYVEMDDQGAFTPLCGLDAQQKQRFINYVQYGELDAHY